LYCDDYQLNTVVDFYTFFLRLEEELWHQREERDDKNNKKKASEREIQQIWLEHRRPRICKKVRTQ